MFTKQKVAMLVAEFLGTAVLTLAFLSIITSSIGIPYFVAIGAGLVLALAILLFGGVSGALFNPAITLGLWTVRRITTVQALLYIAVQLLGGLVAYLLFDYLSTVNLGAATENLVEHNTVVLVAEVVGTAILAMGYAAAVYQQRGNFTKAILAGGALVAGIFVASAAATSGFSAGFLNPAVALGAQLWVWTSYVLGPVLGAIIGFNLYGLLSVANAESAAGTTKAAAAAATPAKKKAASKTTKRKTTRKK